MDVFYFERKTEQVVGQIFGHFFCQRQNEAAFVFCDALFDFVVDVFHLAFARPHFDDRIEKTGGSDELFDDLRALFYLFFAGRCAHVDDLVELCGKFGKLERAIVERARQAETEIDEVLFSAPISFVHRAELRDGDVRFVEHAQKIVGKIVEERRRRLSRLPPRDRCGIVFDAGTVAHLFHHFDIVRRARFEAFVFERFFLRFKFGEASVEFPLYALGCGDEQFVRHDKVTCGIDDRFVQIFDRLSRHHVEALYLCDFIPIEFDFIRFVRFHVCRKDFHDVAADSEIAPLQYGVVALVLQRDKFFRDRMRSARFSLFDVYAHLFV